MGDYISDEFDGVMIEDSELQNEDYVKDNDYFDDWDPIPPEED